jgi:hypothetical protein
MVGSETLTILAFIGTMMVPIDIADNICHFLLKESPKITPLF